MMYRPNKSPETKIQINIYMYMYTRADFNPRSFHLKNDYQTLQTRHVWLIISVTELGIKSALHISIMVF